MSHSSVLLHPLNRRTLVVHRPDDLDRGELLQGGDQRVSDNWAVLHDKCLDGVHCYPLGGGGYAQTYVDLAVLIGGPGVLMSDACSTSRAVAMPTEIACARMASVLIRGLIAAHLAMWVTSRRVCQPDNKTSDLSSG